MRLPTNAIAAMMTGILWLSPPGALAAVDNWTSTTSGVWGTAGNWSGGVPVNTSTATFNTIVGLKTAITLSAASATNSLSFSAAGGANAYTFDTAGTVNNNMLTITAGIVNADAATQTFYNAFTLAGNQSWTATSGAMNFNGNVNLGSGATGYTLTVNGANPVSIAGIVANGGSAAGNLTYAGTGTLTLTGANTYTGTTNVNSGTLSIQSNGALGTAANTANTTVASGATLQLSNNITTTNAGTLLLNGTGSGSGALQNLSGSNLWNSNITIASNATIFSSVAGTLLTLGNASATNLFTMGSNTVTFDGPGDTWINSNVGVTGDTGGLIKNGTGKLTLYGYNTFYTGATVVNAGSVDLLVGPFNTGIYGINGSLTIGAGSSNPALAGTVNVNIASNSYANQLSPTSAVTINSDGALNVGAATSLGSLTLNGGQVKISSGIAISPTGSITSNTNSAHETSLISGGQVTLSGATNFTVARDSTITSDLTVSSTLSGGSIVKQGAGVLTLAAANTLTGTTISAGTINAQATNALGTTNGATIASGATLQLQGGISLGQTSTTLSGTGVSGNGAIENVSGSNTLSGALTLAANSTIQSDAGTLTVSGGITGTNTNLTMAGAGNTTVSSGITTGTGGATLSGTGTTTFSGAANTYTGDTTVNSGTLNLSKAANVTAIAGNLILNGGTVNETATGQIAATSTLTVNSGTFAVTGGTGNTLATVNSSIGSAISLVTGSTLTINGAGASTVNGVITGAGALTKQGAGNLTLSGANTFTGAAMISAGTLTAGAQNVLSTSSGVTVGSGGTLNLNNFNQTITGLNSSGTLNFGSTGGETLTLTGANTLAGTMAGAIGTLVVGSGATLTLGASFSDPGLNIVLAGGTLNLNGTTDTFGSLQITGNSSLDFASAANSLLTVSGVSFLNTSLTLSVTNWANAQDYFYSISSPGPQGVTPTNQIVFTGFSGNSTKWLSSDHEVTPVPEPSTYGAILTVLCLGAFLFRRRKIAAQQF
ncbi:MAG TPA: autotransporter-associated beta strand repeat-containing protein [Opitutaceae bacterium]|nr:autotransporter-associated beta strand repeat-containing protein [Opitutaceae bacterium]